MGETIQILTMIDIILQKVQYHTKIGHLDMIWTLEYKSIFGQLMETFFGLQMKVLLSGLPP